jgi:signal transduction histidine kinase
MTTKKILVVDSDRDFLRAMADLLDGQGHSTVTVADVLEALDILVDYAPEIIFLDLLLPRIGGDDFCRILRGIDTLRDSTIIIVSGILVEQGREISLLGADACIAKGPFEAMSAHVLEAVRTSGRKQAGDEPVVLGSEGRRMRQATRALLARNKSLRMILESTSQGIIELHGRRIVYANPRALSFLALPLEKVLGRYLAEVLPEEAGRQIAPLLAGYGLEEGEDGQYLPVRIQDRHMLLQVTPVREDPDKRIVLLSDVTEIRKMESVVEATNLTDKLGYIFSGIRHEIGNPVNSIKVALSVLRRNIDQYGKATVVEFIERSLLEVARIEYLLKALKNYSLFESPDIQRFRVEDFIANFIPLVQDEFARRKVELRVMCATDAGSATADPRALHHALLNILTNAADAVDGRDDGRVIVSVMRSAPWVEIKIDDNGCGISEADRKNLFRPFFTSKKNGTGLGLVIVKKMLGKMNGRISITSYANCGTTVTIALPEAEDDGRLCR